ncbi:MAG: 50S ribosomal protein L3 [Patescibacteria group bacterium]|nr:50S ribosomal protein L3 [Patescibacteria group bacterium]
MNLQGLIGKKTYQSQGFLQDGTRVPLSAISVLDNLISQIKTADKDGYNSVQIGFEIKKKPNKALEGHGKKAGLNKTPRFLKEIRVDDVTGLELGAKIDTNEVFKPGDIVDVSGVSKGKGFAGGVKRWHFKGGPRTHGQSDRERAPGSIGQTTTPGRVYKGKKMAGKMGDTTATVRNLEVIEITADGIILIKGLIPGSKGTVVVIKKVGENKKFVPLYKEVVEEKEQEVQAPAEGVLKSTQQLEESSDASTPASTEAADSGHGPDGHRDSNEDSSPVESPRASEEIVSAESETASVSSEEEVAAVPSGEDGQVPIAEDQKPEEAKEEVKEDAK